jgi:hypothetical protein
MECFGIRKGQQFLGLCTDLRKVPARVQIFLHGKDTGAKHFARKFLWALGCHPPAFPGGKREEKFWDFLSGKEFEGTEPNLHFMTAALSRKLAEGCFGGAGGRPR